MDVSQKHHIRSAKRRIKSRCQNKGTRRYQLQQRLTLREFRSREATPKVTPLCLRSLAPRRARHPTTRKQLGGRDLTFVESVGRWRLPSRCGASAFGDQCHDRASSVFHLRSSQRAPRTGLLCWDHACVAGDELTLREPTAVDHNGNIY